MELFLLLIPAVILPIGLSLAGIWWLFSEDRGEEEMYLEDDFADGGF